MRFTRIAALAYLAAALAPLAACGGPEHTETRSYDLTEYISAARVNSDGGRIDIVAGTQNVIRVTETLRYNADKPAPRHSLHSADVEFTSGCNGIRGNCGVDYRLEVPAAVAATLNSGGGAITISGLSGALDVESGGGQVVATATASTTFTARTGGGGADLEFATPSDTIHIESAGGNVIIRLPQESYAIDVSTDGGGTRIDVADDPASRHKINVRSGGGDVAAVPATAGR